MIRTKFIRFPGFVQKFDIRFILNMTVSRCSVYSYALWSLAGIGEAIYTHSKWVDESVDRVQSDDFGDYEHRSQISIRTPRFDTRMPEWFNLEKAQTQFNEINAKLKVELSGKYDADDGDANRSSGEYLQTLKDDLARAHKLNQNVQKVNAKFRAESGLGGELPYSLVQVRSHHQLDREEPVISDWAFCTCGSGENGTLAFPERGWPGVDLPTPPTIDLRSSSNATRVPDNSNNTEPLSMLQLTVEGRHLSLPRADHCDCANPWEGYDDPSRSSLCALSNGVTLCLVRVNTAEGVLSPDQLREEAGVLLKAIDSSFNPTSSLLEKKKRNSFVELWKPFQFQL